jgi:pentatricopeptide repeat protein
LCKHMYSYGVIPDTMTYHSLINGLCKKRAEKLLQTMISEGLDLDVVTYNTLMNELCKKPESNKVKELLGDMIYKDRSLM